VAGVLQRLDKGLKNRYTVLYIPHQPGKTGRLDDDSLINRRQLMAIPLPLKSGGTYLVNPSKIIALGLNYLEHIKESRMEDVPTEPLLFAKTPNVLIGPGEAIVVPAFLAEYGFRNCRTDYEAELAIIISQRCKNLPADQALDHILGFTCFNDISQRNLQKNDKSGWFRGKSLDTFGPIGPVIVSPADLGDPHNLQIRCRLNGKVVQDGNTRDMIFKIPEVIAFISKNFTLEAGDIIITGTPSGVGPIADGDVVEVEIEGIGVLSNPVRGEN
jgi:2-keto-4-pentenoate hydratase/2-oxohepta-3-ene-1,7-dioic acid hydratase in catechol pathway